MAAVLLSLIIGANDGGGEVVLTDSVALIETNHYYDARRRLVFSQTIFYDWCPVARRYQVTALRLVKTAGEPRPYPKPVRFGRGYLLVFQDHGDRLRRIYAGDWRETRTFYDPEMLERRKLPKDERRGLSIFKKR